MAGVVYVAIDGKAFMVRLQPLHSPIRLVNEGYMNHLTPFFSAKKGAKKLSA